MRKDENGDVCPETLGEYYAITKAMFGEQMGKKALEFLQEKIDKAPNGKDEKVISDDSQMRGLIFNMINLDL